MSDHAHGDVKAPVPHVLPTMVYIAVLGALIFLTVVTVAVAQVDLGPFNFPVAMLVATVKASLVAAIFMHLWWDSKLNAVVFICTLLFLAIFIVLTASDLLSRTEVDPIRRNYSVRDEKVQKFELEHPGQHMYPAAVDGPLSPEDWEKKYGKKIVDQDAEAHH